MPTKKILIADDHSAIRKGVRLILANEFMNAEFGEAVNAQEVLEKVHAQPWDVIILDIDMPGRNALDMMKQFKTEKLNIPVLVFSMYREELIALRAFKLGAYAYISKESADTELVNALNTIFLGKKYITPSIAELLAAQLQDNQNTTPHQSLSDRELQTFLRIASGKSVSQIAQELSLSVPTICTYRARIIEKTGLKNNAEMAAYATRNHLI
jgi:two-component system, NarL family, invasion response regulator UvrY